MGRMTRRRLGAVGFTTALAALAACAPIPSGGTPTTSLPDESTTTVIETTTTTTSTTASTTTVPATTSTTTTTSTPATTTTTTTVPGPRRYLDLLFPSATVTSNLTYASAVNNQGQLQSLELDIYQPTGDTATDRPAVVWVHGGGFYAGNKTSDATFLRSLARLGYVVVSIEYRLEHDPSWNLAQDDPLDLAGDPEFMAAAFRALEDSRSAIAWLRSNATTRRIDPERIAIAGASAGGITALNAAYALDATDGFNGPSDPSRVSAAVSLVGATLPEWIQAGEPPAFMANGSADPLVPTALSQPVCPAAAAVNVYCEYHSYVAGHGFSATQALDVQAKVTLFLFDHLVSNSTP